MSKQQENNPLHGVKLADILTKLVDHYGWEKLAEKIRLSCFVNKPSHTSSLKMLRRTPWARERVENLYLWTFCRPKRNKRRPKPEEKE